MARKGGGVIQNNDYSTIIVQAEYLVSLSVLFTFLGIEDTVTPLVSLARKRHEV